MDDERPQVPEFKDMLEAAAHHRWGCPICGGDHRADRCSAIPFRVEPMRLVLNCDEIKAFELRGAAELAAYDALLELEGEGIMLGHERTMSSEDSDGPTIVLDTEGVLIGRGDTTIEALIAALHHSATAYKAWAQRETAQTALRNPEIVRAWPRATGFAFRPDDARDGGACEAVAVVTAACNEHEHAHDQCSRPSEYLRRALLVAEELERNA